MKKVGIGLAGTALTACQPITIHFQNLDPVSEFPSSPPSSTPQPTPIPPPPIPTFSPEQLPALLSQEEIDFIANHEVREGDTSRPVVMMTYDDNAKYAQVRAILDAYNKHDMKATFFFIGEKMPLSAKAVRAIVDEGHLLGCHGYTHLDLQVLNDDQVNRQFERMFEATHEVVPGYRLRFIRFPYGNGAKDQRLLNIAASWGLQHVYWTTGSGGLHRNTHDTVLRNASNGTIVLSHMFRMYDIEQAEGIIVSLMDKGFSIETVETGRKPEDIYGRSID